MYSLCSLLTHFDQFIIIQASNQPLNCTLTKLGHVLDIIAVNSFEPTFPT